LIDAIEKGILHIRGGKRKEKRRFRKYPKREKGRGGGGFPAPSP